MLSSQLSSKLHSASMTLHGNQVTIQHFSKQLEVKLNVTSVHTWKLKYMADISEWACPN